MSLTKQFAAVLLAGSTMIGLGGCVTDGIGVPTVAGAAAGGLGTSLLTDNKAAIGLGALGGAAVGYFFEPNCDGSITTVGTRHGEGNSSTPWKTTDVLKNKCNLDGNTEGKSFGTPDYLGNMGGSGAQQRLLPIGP